VAIGRGARYFTEGFLALRYGDQAIEFIRENGRTVSLWLVAGLLAVLAGYLLWRKAVTSARR
jgi:hypothetical protein